MRSLPHIAFVMAVAISPVAAQPPAAGQRGRGEASPPDRITVFAERLLNQYDKNQDGVLQENEWRELRGVTAAQDADSDGSITKEELKQWMMSRFRQGGLGSQTRAPAIATGESRPQGDAAAAATAPDTAIDGPVERLLVIMRHAPALSVAEALNRHFASSQPSQVRVVADAVSNSLLVTASPELLKDVTAAVERLDRAPATIEVKVVAVEQARHEPAAVEGAPSRSTEAEAEDASLESGAAKDVLKKIERWEAQGKVSVLHRIRMTMLENQQGLVQIGQNKPVVQGLVSASRGEGRNVNYQSVGLLVSATARRAGENAVALELNFEKSDVATNPDDPPLAVTSAGEKIPSTRTVTSTAKTTLLIARGQAVVLADVSSKGSADQNRLLLVVTADAFGAGGKNGD